MSETSKSVGDTGRPLPRKLGLKPGQTVAFVGLPPNLEFLASVEDFAEVDRVRVADELGPSLAHDVVHAFYTRMEDLQVGLSCLRAAIKPAGMIWISWPKKAASKSFGVATDITEDVVRALALERGLVDVKVCAIDEVWSGLKLVIPVAQRTGE